MTYVVCVPSLAGLRDTVINTREQVGVVRVTLLLLLRHSVEKRIAEAKRARFEEIGKPWFGIGFVKTKNGTMEINGTELHNEGAPHVVSLPGPLREVCPVE